MNKVDRKHIVLQVKTKNVIRFPPLEKLLSLKVMKPSKTAVKTADRMDHFKRHCKLVGSDKTRTQGKWVRVKEMSRNSNL